MSISHRKANIPPYKDHDGVIWPWDTFTGFHKLGFGLLLSFVAVLVIHGNFSYPTAPGWLPDPFFRVNVPKIHKDKHGSDTGTYDLEGRFLPQKFEDMFAKYADGRDYLTLGDVWALLKGQRCIMDPVGWGGAFFECKLLHEYLKHDYLSFLNTHIPMYVY